MRVNQLFYLLIQKACSDHFYHPRYKTQHIKHLRVFRKNEKYLLGVRRKIKYSISKVFRIKVGGFLNGTSALTPQSYYVNMYINT